GPLWGHTGRNISLYWRYEKALRKAESDVDSTLGVTGAIYAIRREFVEPIPDDTILDDIEIPLKAFRKGYRVIFEPGAVAYDKASSEIETEFRRKVRTLTGNFQLFSRNRWLLSPFENRIFIQSISHKLFRLFIPYALMAVLLTTSMLENSMFKLLFWGQVICYLAGAAAILVKGLRRNRTLNFISVFLSLNTASVVALYKYSFNKVDVTWRDQP
ncbi:MAG: glycosyltransferase family 2 protein, partial [Candidatus Krumholzibacteria bacterium]|nr:glycosyltransferase family 2 protein [Candidatus Krumholzibacteria bacterium]